MNSVKFNLKSLIGEGSNISILDKHEDYVAKVMNHELDYETFKTLKENIKFVGVTDDFINIIEHFKVKGLETPAGFKIEYKVENQVLYVHLRRDISYDKNGIKRATKFIFSADSANPYEVEPIKDLLGNLTCNPGIIYDLFLNNPKANVGNKFKNRNEVMEELGRILGPGCDISVELNNPFSDINELLEEAAEFKELLSEHRVVIKVPHTGPVNATNVHKLMTGDKKFPSRYNQGSTEDFLRGHNIALRLHEEGYRVNFTLMFEPYQTALALQAKPYFINSFIRHRLIQTNYIRGLMSAYNSTHNENFLIQIKKYMIENDYLSPNDESIDLLSVKVMAENILKYRMFDESQNDGLDGVRHNLRMLRNANLPDTRLIICSMEGPHNYPDIDKLLVEDEFKDMTDRIVITAEPEYLAKFTTTNQVISYQRRFMNAVN